MRFWTEMINNGMRRYLGRRENGPEKRSSEPSYYTRPRAFDSSSFLKVCKYMKVGTTFPIKERERERERERENKNGAGKVNQPFPVQVLRKIK